MFQVSHRPLAGWRWATFVLDFATDVEPPYAHHAIEALMLLVDNIHDDSLPPWPYDWAQSLLNDLYAHYDGPFYGEPSNYLALVDNFFTWVHGRGEMDEWTLSDLLDRVDELREASGLESIRGATGSAISESSLGWLIESFIRARGESFADPVLRANPALVHQGIRNAHSFLCGQGRPGRFDALDADAYARFLIECGACASPHSAVALLGLVAEFVAFLPVCYVESDRGGQVACGLRQWAARLALRAA